MTDRLGNGTGPAQPVLRPPNRAGRMEQITGIDDADIEHYHRIRNKLYHDGTGLSVDEQYLLAYRQIAVLLLKNLFGVDLGEPRPAPTLERLIVLWNQIQETLESQLNKAGITHRHTFIGNKPCRRA